MRDTTLEKLRNLTRGRVEVRQPLKRLTTLRIGGPARYFVRARSVVELVRVLRAADRLRLPWYVLGEGSNLVPSDAGFAGLVVKNEIKGLRMRGRRVFVGTGHNLFQLVRALNRQGLAGLERMAGIPGTVGGAMYGSAGAYGQEIKDCLVRVKIFDAGTSRRSSEHKNRMVRWFSKPQCRFGYRESVFKKHKRWVILAAEFRFKKSEPSGLQKISRDIVKLRAQKYRPGLLCPGSFFKNIVVAALKPPAARRKLLAAVDPSRIKYGKIPAGYLLEAVGARGLREGNIVVAEHHGNLIYNSGRGRASDVRRLARALKARVRERFGIELEEEVQYL